MPSPMEKRMLVYPWLTVTAYIISCIYNISNGIGWFIRSDFICFYAASLKVWAGDILGIYDIYKFNEFEQQLAGQFLSNYGFLPWMYPPVFLIFISPLAAFPYLPALILWLAITLIGYVFVIYKMAPHPTTVGLALAFPGTLLNLLFAQNGFLSAFFLGAGLLLLKKQPITAGILLGLLIYKPQLALLVAVALFAGKMWRAFVAGSVTVIILVVSSIALYGIESWYAFYKAIPFMQSAMNTDLSQCGRMQTIFASARLAGLPVQIAYGLQGIFSIAAVILVTWVWRQRIFPMAYIILTAGIFFATPYALVYDLTIIGLTIALYSWHAFQNGWLPGEKIVLALAWFMPLFSLQTARFIHIQIAPIILLAIIILAIKRIRFEKRDN